MVDENTGPAARTTAEAVRAGLRQRCAVCGEGRVFSGFLKLNEACPSCGADFSRSNTGDGPAFFVSFIALVLFAPFFFLIPMVDAAIPVRIVAMVFAVGLMTGFCLWLLPRAKSLLLALQVHHDAEEGRFE